MSVLGRLDVQHGAVVDDGRAESAGELHVRRVPQGGVDEPGVLLVQRDQVGVGCELRVAALQLGWRQVLKSVCNEQTRSVVVSTVKSYKSL